MTVERRNSSAISPKPGMLMSVARFGIRVLPLADDDADVANDTAAQDSCCKRLTDVFSVQVRVHSLEMGNGLVVQRDQDVAEDDAGTMGRALRFDFKHNGCGLLG